jgi:hypothetical protein
VSSEWFEAVEQVSNPASAIASASCGGALNRGR